MYPSTADLVAASTVEALTGLTTPQKNALRDAAIQAVESFCGQQFTAEGTIGSPVTRRVDGTGTDTLYLPARISDLVSVTATNGDLSVESVQISDDRQRLTITGLTGTTWADRAFADFRGFPEPVFPAGADNIEVSGVWGWTDDEYSTYLTAVSTALRFDMEDKALAGGHALGDTVRASRALGLGAVNQGRVSIDLSGQEPMLSVRARQQLRSLVFNHAGGAVV